MSDRKILGKRKPIIGMIHTQALPGTPNYKGSVKAVIEKAKKETVIYKNAGIEVVMVENMHDIPYLKRRVGPEITSMMSIVGYEVKNETGLACGIQILAGANKAALASAHSAGLDFIRAEGFVFAHVADDGIMESDAGELLRYKKQIGAENILIFTDVKKKHSSNSITSDISIVETAKAAEFFQSDGIILTGATTADPANPDDVIKVKEATNLPVIIGSGINLNNIEKYYDVGDAFIVGSYFKQGGYWKNEIDLDRVKALVEKIK
jgi:uncharacterized protein